MEEITGMRILLLPSYFFTERTASSRLDKDRYEAFANHGIHMICFSPLPTKGVDRRTRQMYRKKCLETYFNDMLVVRYFYMFREGSNVLLRALRYFLCALVQLFYGCITKNVDLIYVCSTPPIQGALAAIIKKIKHIPFIYNLQDIFPDSLIGAGFAKKGSILWKIGRIIENFTYKNADKIIVISEDFKKNIIQKGVPENKIKVIYNWIDAEKVVPINRENNPLFEELSLDKTFFYVVYAGNLGHAQNVEVMLDAAKVLAMRNSIYFLIFGSGGYENEYRKMITERKLTNISIFPIQPIEKVSYVYSLGDVGIVSCKKGLGGSAMPSKTWSILAAGRPVIANLDKNEIKDILLNNNCGLFTEAGNLNSFVDAILSFYDNPEMCKLYGKNGRNFVLKHLNKTVATDNYVKEIKLFE